ncbi:MAG: hypothetical protein ACLFR1_11355 [Spirochaetia bacterium]
MVSKEDAQKTVKVPGNQEKKTGFSVHVLRKQRKPSRNFCPGFPGFKQR